MAPELPSFQPASRPTMPKAAASPPAAKGTEGTPTVVIPAVPATGSAPSRPAPKAPAAPAALGAPAWVLASARHAAAAAIPPPAASGAAAAAPAKPAPRTLASRLSEIEPAATAATPAPALKPAPAGPRAHAAAPAKPGEADKTNKPTRPGGPRRRGRWIAAGVVAAVIVAGIVVAGVWHSGHGHAQAGPSAGVPASISYLSTESDAAAVSAQPLPLPSVSVVGSGAAVAAPSATPTPSAAATGTDPAAQAAAQAAVAAGLGSQGSSFTWQPTGAAAKATRCLNPTATYQGIAFSEDETAAGTLAAGGLRLAARLPQAARGTAVTFFADIVPTLDKKDFGCRQARVARNGLTSTYHLGATATLSTAGGTARTTLTGPETCALLTAQTAGQELDLTVIYSANGRQYFRTVVMNTKANYGLPATCAATGATASATHPAPVTATAIATVTVTAAPTAIED